MSDQTTDIWTPSDKLLLADPIAEAKVAHPHDVADDIGMILPASERVDHEANAQAAAVVLAETESDDDPDPWTGTCDDDHAIEDDVPAVLDPEL